MNVSAKPTGTWQHTLTVNVPVEEVEEKLETIAHRVRSRVTLPGFRRGKVPLDLVRQQYAEAIEQDFVETFLPRLASEAIDEAKLRPVVTPMVRDLHFAPGQPLVFEVVVDVRPEVEAKNYRGLAARRTSRPIDDAAVAGMIEDLREQSAVYVDLDRPAERGDVVLLDSTRLDANGRRLPSTRAKGRRILLGAPDLLPDLENGLLGATAGQERTFEVNYPSDYAIEDLAGKKARYVVKVRKIQAKKLRDLDDNLARDVFQLETIEALRSRVRANLEHEENTRMRRELEESITQELLARNTFELPERWVEWMLERVIDDAVGSRDVPESLRKELEPRYRPGVERTLKRSVLLDSIARQERIEASDAEVSEEISRMAQAEPRHAARIRARYQASERREALRDSLREHKTMDWLINVAEIREETAGASPVAVPAGR